MLPLLSFAQANLKVKKYSHKIINYIKTINKKEKKLIKMDESRKG